VWPFKKKPKWKIMGVRLGPMVAETPYTSFASILNYYVEFGTGKYLLIGSNKLRIEGTLPEPLANDNPSADGFIRMINRDLQRNLIDVINQD